MCLTIPKQVLSVKKDSVLLKNRNKKENAGAIIKVKKDDWVLTQNSIIIKKITAKQAKEIKNLLKL